MHDLFDPSWELPDLGTEDCAPYELPHVSDEEKRGVWEAYRAGNPTRTPVFISVTDRGVLLDGRVACGDLTYERTFADPEAMLQAALLWQYVYRRRYNRFCDSPRALPDTWRVPVSFQNTYEAWSFGCPLCYCPGEVPDTAPAFTDGAKRAVFDVDIDHPLERDPYKRAIEFYEFLVDYVADKTFLDRPIGIDVPAYFGTDGPLTVAMSVRGSGILTDLVVDPGYANELFGFVIDAALKRRQALIDHFDV